MSRFKNTIKERRAKLFRLINKGIKKMMKQGAKRVAIIVNPNKCKLFGYNVPANNCFYKSYLLIFDPACNTKKTYVMDITHWR